MTNNEKQEIQRAINTLLDNNDIEHAIAILSNLI